MMDGEYKGATVADAIRKSLQPEMQRRRSRELQERTRKGRFSVVAPPLFWGPWTEIWATFGHRGPNPDRHRATLHVSFESISQVPSSFSVEIRGGDRLIRTVGPGSARVSITGNVSTAVSIRCKSHSILQHVIVSL